MTNDFYTELAKMKQILRRGWLLRGVPNRTESDAEHTFSMLMLALEIMAKNDTKLDQLKVLKMIAYHELCEIDAGDVTPADNVSKQTKYNNELKGIKRIAKQYNMPEIESLWLEFEENKTPEAKFVKEIDKLDAVLQSKIYAEQFNMPTLYEEFYLNAKDKIQNIEPLER